MKNGCALLTAGILLFAGCETHRDYRSADLSSEKAYKKGKSSAQLNENDVLGLDKDNGVSDADIQRILDETRSFSLPERSTVLVVQSGDRYPDPEMVAELSKHFTVIPSSGIPAEVKSEAAGNTAKALRLAAARAKAETIVVYWGNLEIKRDEMVTGIVSWVPVVDFVVPDEHQRVRMNVKVALIDVRTGQWATFRTEPVEDQALTTRYAREKAPNWPLKSIKQKAYRASVQKLVDAYVFAKN